MIGAVLHLWQRAVDRLAGADAASLRVTLAALSARVAAAEGEAARLRGELANAHRACGHALTVEAAATAEAVMGRGAAQAEAENLRCECDELRVEVERLTRERAEALQWRGVAASVEREAAEERLQEAIRERDAARDTVSELSYKLDAAGHEWFETEKERDAARADLATLRRLARAFLNALDHGDCDNVFKCDADRCHRVASQRTLDPYGDYCDEHAESMSPVDKSFAPALRALRAALPTEAGDG